MNPTSRFRMDRICRVETQIVSAHQGRTPFGIQDGQSNSGMPFGDRKHPPAARFLHGQRMQVAGLGRKAVSDGFSGLRISITFKPFQSATMA